MIDTFQPEQLHFKLISLPNGKKCNILRSSLKDNDDNYLYDGDVVELAFNYEDGETFEKLYYLRYMNGKGFVLIPNCKEDGEVIYEFEMSYSMSRDLAKEGYVSVGRYYNLHITSIIKLGNGYSNPDLIYCPF